MNKIYLVRSYCEDEAIEGIVGCATTEEKAIRMVGRLALEFEDAFDYEIIPFEIDAIFIDDEKINF